MIQEWMLYTFVVTLLFAWAAWALEDIAVGRGWPTRLIWIGAVLGSLLLPQTLHLRPERQPSVTITLRGVTSPEIVLGVPTTAVATPNSSDTAPLPLRSYEREVKAVWMAMSGLVLIAFLISFLLITVRRRGWSAKVMRRRRVWISSDTGPAVVGFFPGEIVLPDWMLGAPPADCRLAVAHEEEHIRSRDPLLVLGIAVACTAMPWNLPLWYIARRLRRSIELDCDRRLLDAGVDPRAYGRLLIEVTERGLAHHLVVTAFSDSPSFLEQRLRLILGKRPQSSLRFGLMTAAASVLLLLASSLNPPPGQAEEVVRSPEELRRLRIDDAVEIFQVTDFPGGAESTGSNG